MEEDILPRRDTAGQRRESELYSGKLPPLVGRWADLGGSSGRKTVDIFCAAQWPWGFCNERESDSAGAEDFAGEGEEGAGFVVPLDGALEAPGGFAGLVGRHFF